MARHRHTEETDSQSTRTAHTHRHNLTTNQGNGAQQSSPTRGTPQATTPTRGAGRRPTQSHSGTSRPKAPQAHHMRGTGRRQHPLTWPRVKKKLGAIQKNERPPRAATPKTIVAAVQCTDPEATECQLRRKRPFHPISFEVTNPIMTPINTVTKSSAPKNKKHCWSCEQAPVNTELRVGRQSRAWDLGRFLWGSNSGHPRPCPEIPAPSPRPSPRCEGSSPCPLSSCRPRGPRLLLRTTGECGTGAAP